MTPIAQWLGSLGLSEYADRFAENRIDLSILQHLTDQDLKDIGVVLMLCLLIDCYLGKAYYSVQYRIMSD